MTTLLAGPSRNTDRVINTKPNRKHNAAIISGSSKSQHVNQTTTIDCINSRQNVSSLVEQPSVSIRRAKLNATLSNKLKETLDENSSFRSGKILKCSTSRLSKYYNSITFECDKNPKNNTNFTKLQEANQGVNCPNSILTDHGVDQKRKLRSQKCSKFKSELSTYFPEYDVVIGNERPDDYVLNADTQIFIFDSADKSLTPTCTKQSSNDSLIDYTDVLFTKLRNAEKVDFSYLSSFDRNSDEDLLCNTYYESMHKKPQRAEKTCRNDDRERALHDKEQIIRLLEGLQGHDWQKLMGVSGAPESKKREFDAARQYFILGCRSIVAKFRLWREKEKQQKTEKGTALISEANEQQAHLNAENNTEYSDSGHSATKQLLQDARVQSTVGPSRIRKKPVSDKFKDVPKSYEIQREFKSFFTKPHLREVALGRQRRPGRVAFAWGYPIPEIPQRNFSLSGVFRNEESLLVWSRRKRKIEKMKKKYIHRKHEKMNNIDERSDVDV